MLAWWSDVKQKVISVFMSLLGVGFLRYFVDAHKHIDLAGLFGGVQLLDLELDVFVINNEINNSTPSKDLRGSSKADGQDSTNGVDHYLYESALRNKSLVRLKFGFIKKLTFQISFTKGKSHLRLSDICLVFGPPIQSAPLPTLPKHSDRTKFLYTHEYAMLLQSRLDSIKNLLKPLLSNGGAGSNVTADPSLGQTQSIWKTFALWLLRYDPHMTIEIDRLHVVFEDELPSLDGHLPPSGVSCSVTVTYAQLAPAGEPWVLSWPSLKNGMRTKLGPVSENHTIDVSVNALSQKLKKGDFVSPCSQIVDCPLQGCVNAEATLSSVNSWANIECELDAKDPDESDTADGIIKNPSRDGSNLEYLDRSIAFGLTVKGFGIYVCQSSELLLSPADELEAQKILGQLCASNSSPSQINGSAMTARSPSSEPPSQDMRSARHHAMNLGESQNDRVLLSGVKCLYRAVSIQTMGSRLSKRVSDINDLRLKNGNKNLNKQTIKGSSSNPNQSHKPTIANLTWLLDPCSVNMQFQVHKNLDEINQESTSGTGAASSEASVSVSVKSVSPVNVNLDPGCINLLVPLWLSAKARHAQVAIGSIEMPHFMSIRNWSSRSCYDSSKGIFPDRTTSRSLLRELVRSSISSVVRANNIENNTPPLLGNPTSSAAKNAFIELSKICWLERFLHAAGKLEAQSPVSSPTDRGTPASNNNTYRPNLDSPSHSQRPSRVSMEYSTGKNNNLITKSVPIASTNGSENVPRLFLTKLEPEQGDRNRQSPLVFETPTGDGMRVSQRATLSEEIVNNIFALSYQGDGHRREITDFAFYTKESKATLNPVTPPTSSFRQRLSVNDTGASKTNSRGKTPRRSHDEAEEICSVHYRRQWLSLMGLFYEIPAVCLLKVASNRDHFAWEETCLMVELLLRRSDWWTIALWHYVAVCESKYQFRILFQYFNSPPCNVHAPTDYLWTSSSEDSIGPWLGGQLRIPIGRILSSGNMITSPLLSRSNFLSGSEFPHSYPHGSPYFFWKQTFSQIRAVVQTNDRSGNGFFMSPGDLSALAVSWNSFTVSDSWLQSPSVEQLTVRSYLGVSSGPHHSQTISSFKMGSFTPRSNFSSPDYDIVRFKTRVRASAAIKFVVSNAELLSPDILDANGLRPCRQFFSHNIRNGSRGSRSGYYPSTLNSSPFGNVAAVLKKYTHGLTWASGIQEAQPIRSSLFDSVGCETPLHSQRLIQDRRCSPKYQTPQVEAKKMAASDLSTPQKLGSIRNNKRQTPRKMNGADLSSSGDDEKTDTDSWEASKSKIRFHVNDYLMHVPFGLNIWDSHSYCKNTRYENNSQSQTQNQQTQPTNQQPMAISVKGIRFHFQSLIFRLNSQKNMSNRSPCAFELRLADVAFSAGLIRQDVSVASVIRDVKLVNVKNKQEDETLTISPSLTEDLRSPRSRERSSNNFSRNLSRDALTVPSLGSLFPTTSGDVAQGSERKRDAEAILRNLFQTASELETILMVTSSVQDREEDETVQFLERFAEQRLLKQREKDRSEKRSSFTDSDMILVSDFHNSNSEDGSADSGHKNIFRKRTGHHGNVCFSDIGGLKLEPKSSLKYSSPQSTGVSFSPAERPERSDSCRIFGDEERGSRSRTFTSDPEEESRSATGTVMTSSLLGSSTSNSCQSSKNSKSDFEMNIPNLLRQTRETIIFGRQLESRDASSNSWMTSEEPSTNSIASSNNSFISRRTLELNPRITNVHRAIENSSQSLRSTEKLSSGGCSQITSAVPYSPPDKNSSSFEFAVYKVRAREQTLEICDRRVDNSGGSPLGSSPSDSFASGVPMGGRIVSEPALEPRWLVGESLSALDKAETASACYGESDSISDLRRKQTTGFLDKQLRGRRLSTSPDNVPKRSRLSSLASFWRLKQTEVVKEEEEEEQEEEEDVEETEANCSKCKNEKRTKWNGLILEVQLKQIDDSIAPRNGNSKNPNVIMNSIPAVNLIISVKVPEIHVNHKNTTHPQWQKLKELIDGTFPNFNKLRKSESVLRNIALPQLSRKEIKIILKYFQECLGRNISSLSDFIPQYREEYKMNDRKIKPEYSHATGSSTQRDLFRRAATGVGFFRLPEIDMNKIYQQNNFSSAAMNLEKINPDSDSIQISFSSSRSNYRNISASFYLIHLFVKFFSETETGIRLTARRNGEKHQISKPARRPISKSVIRFWTQRVLSALRVLSCSVDIKAADEATPKDFKYKKSSSLFFGSYNNCRLMPLTTGDASSQKSLLENSKSKGRQLRRDWSASTSIAFDTSFANSRFRAELNPLTIFVHSDLSASYGVELRHGESSIVDGIRIHGIRCSSGFKTLREDIIKSPDDNQLKTTKTVNDSNNLLPVRPVVCIACRQVSSIGHSRCKKHSADATYSKTAMVNQRAPEMVHMFADEIISYLWSCQHAQGWLMDILGVGSETKSDISKEKLPPSDIIRKCQFDISQIENDIRKAVLKYEIGTKILENGLRGSALRSDL